MLHNAVKEEITENETHVTYIFEMESYHLQRERSGGTDGQKHRKKVVTNAHICAYLRSMGHHIVCHAPRTKYRNSAGQNRRYQVVFKKDEESKAPQRVTKKKESLPRKEYTPKKTTVSAKKVVPTMSEKRKNEG
jgi:hypothetical protein